MSKDTIYKQAAIDAVWESTNQYDAERRIKALQPAEPEIVRCKDCKYWVRQTYQGTPLSRGNCESEHMWDSLCGETYEVASIDTNENHFCGYAERENHE